MSYPVLLLVASQIMFSISDLVARSYTSRLGFTLGSLMSGWFVTYAAIRAVATIIQLYAFSQVELGKIAIILGAVSIIAAQLLGFFLLSEALNVRTYLALACAMAAFLLLALSSK